MYKQLNKILQRIPVLSLLFLCLTIGLCAVVGVVDVKQANAEASGVTDGDDPVFAVSKEEAANNVINSITAEKIWQEADQIKGLRVHQYGQLLPDGTHIQSAFAPNGAKSSALACKNPSWLFFIDEDPMAHFAHPARVILIDAVTGEEQVMRISWWPQIDGKPIFSTVKERSNPETIILDQSSALDLNGQVRGICAVSNH